MVAQLKAMAEVEGVGYQTILKRVLVAGLPERASEAVEEETPETTDEVEAGPPEPTEEPARADASDLSQTELDDIFENVP